MFFKRPLLTFIFLPAVVMLVVFLVFVNKAPLMIIDAEARHLHYTVSNSEEARVSFLTEAMVKPSPKADGFCIQGILEPASGAIVSYNIIANSLVIRVSDGHYIDAYTRQRMSLTEASSISYGVDVGKCEPARAPLLLPIWGPTNIGEATKGQNLVTRRNPFSGTLLGGSVRLFGRNIIGNGIYPAGEFSLPAGSQLASVSNQSQLSGAWWGYASYHPVPEPHSITHLEISASTIASDLSMKRRGAGLEPEYIQVGYLTRITSDPSSALFIAIMAGIFFISEMLVALRELFRHD